MDDEILALERRIREGSATEPDVDRWDARRILAGAWSAELVGRQVMRSARRLLPDESDARAAIDVLRGLVDEARRETHWLKAASVTGLVRLTSGYSNQGRMLSIPGVPGRRIAVMGIQAAILEGPTVLILRTGDAVLARWSVSSGQGVPAQFRVDDLHVMGREGEGFSLESTTEERGADAVLSMVTYLVGPGGVAVVAVEPDVVALAVTKKLAEAGFLFSLVGGWHYDVTRWIDAPLEGKIVVPRGIAEEWAGVHWRTTG